MTLINTWIFYLAWALIKIYEIRIKNCFLVIIICDKIIGRFFMAKNKLGEQFKTLALADDKQKESDTQVSHPSKKMSKKRKNLLMPTKNNLFAWVKPT